ncbi:hypothetical protein PR048_008955 [Dryococelus australis]|uniref:Peptidase M1 membrane alanine aminopeptidase domain-containing protein n=1 Tax=Dryococelus australis TaxID=614101 RepID=A0ABQ9HYJ3_9NEOP|nr:hypothetical protein PR048_008955 [Dryococelus australis]
MAGEQGLYCATSQVESDWRLEEQFALGCVRTAMTVDSANTSHPMTVDVVDPAQISAIFDTISYQKGEPQLPRSPCNHGFLTCSCHTLPLTGSGV